MVDRRVTQEGLEVDASLDDPTLRITQTGLEADVNLDDPTLRVTQVGLEVDSEGPGNTQVSQEVYEVVIWNTPGLNVAQEVYEPAIDTGDIYPVSVAQLIYEVAIYVPPTEEVTFLPKIWTHHRSVNLPVSLWRPYYDPATYTLNPKSSYVTTIHDAEDYSHKITATGGYWESSFTIKGSAEIADEWLDEGLGRHVEVHDEAGVLIWEGFVNEINVSSGGFSVSSGPLTEVANRVYVHYEELDTTTNPPTNNGPLVAGPYTDTDSVEIYGRWEKVFRAGELTTTEAEQVAQLYLEKYSWPQLSKDIELGAEQSSEVSIDISCVGYVRRLDYPYTQSILSGGIDLSDKIEMILTYDNTINNLFSVANSEITANTFQVQNYEDQYRLAWELLKQLADEGDLALNRYMMGVYKNRRFFYTQIQEEISYQQHLTDPNQRIENMSGMEIMPWNVLPGKWLMFPDFMVGRVPPGLPLNKDPRVMYIEEVSYKAPYSVTLSQTPVDKVTTRIQQLSLRNQAW